MDPFSPCSPLVPCNRNPDQHRPGGRAPATATAWPQHSHSHLRAIVPLHHVPAPPAHRAQGCCHALLPLSLALSLGLHEPQPSSSQPCTFSPSMPCSPLSPLSPSVPFRPRSPCKGGSTGRGQGMRRSSDTHQGGSRNMGSVGWLEERGQYTLQGRVHQQGKAPPALPRGTGRTGRGRTGTALTGSPLLPRAPGGPSTTTVSPCTPKAERGCEKEARVLPASPLPPPQGLTLSPLGPGAPRSPCEDEGRCSKDAQQGAAAPPWAPQ